MARRTTSIGIFVLLLLTAAVAVWAVGGTARLEQGGEVVITPGATAERTWQQLKTAGYTSSVWPWRFYSWRAAAAARLQSGTYQVQEGEHVRDVIRRFTGGDVADTTRSVTFPEGFTLQQIATRTAAQGISSAEKFSTAAAANQWQEQFSFLASLPAEQSLEGYLFPDTYRIAPNEAPADVIRRMLGTFQRRAIDSGLAAEAAASGRTLNEWVTMASIIEREVTGDEDMAAVSGILWKRYDENIGLAADATVRYAVDKWDAPLTVQDLATDSPYNTRRYAGLPPGPISNPGLRALTAAARPQPSEFYYYLSAPDGRTIFSKTLDEHNTNKAAYLR